MKKLTTIEALDEFRNSPNLSLLKIGAEWCAPCRMLKPLLNESELKETDVNFAEIDADETPELTTQLQVRGIPLLIFYKNGTEVNRRVGMMTSSELGILIEASKRINV